MAWFVMPGRFPGGYDASAGLALEKSTRVAVVGAGHTGVEAARFAAEAGAEIHLFSGEGALSNYRRRLPAVAFDLEEPHAAPSYPPQPAV